MSRHAKFTNDAVGATPDKVDAVAPSPAPAKKSSDRRYALDETVQQGLRDKYEHSKTRKLDVLTNVSLMVDHVELFRLAKQLSMSINDVLAVKEVFDSFDADGSGVLEAKEFEEVVKRVLESQLSDKAQAAERASTASEWHWWDSDTNQSGSISFREFLRWYSSNGFKEDMLLSSEEQALRQLAKRYNMTATDLDPIKKCFDTYDKDNSGAVDIDEFEQIVYKALKIPAHVQLPPSRIQYFWAEIDTDSSGKAQFEEFLQWWLRYFGGSRDMSTGTTTFDSFYSNVRRIGRKYLDPPAYSACSDHKPCASRKVTALPRGQEPSGPDELDSPRNPGSSGASSSSMREDAFSQLDEGEGAWDRLSND